MTFYFDLQWQKWFQKVTEEDNIITFEQIIMYKNSKISEKFKSPALCSVFQHIFSVKKSKTFWQINKKNNKEICRYNSK